jgi:hypothetical protein
VARRLDRRPRFRCPHASRGPPPPYSHRCSCNRPTVGIENALLGLCSRPISSTSARWGRRASRRGSGARQRSAPTISTGVVLTGITVVVRTRPFITKHRVRRRRDVAFDRGCWRTATASPWIPRSVDQFALTLDSMTRRETLATIAEQLTGRPKTF